MTRATGVCCNMNSLTSVPQGVNPGRRQGRSRCPAAYQSAIASPMSIGLSQLRLQSTTLTGMSVWSRIPEARRELLESLVAEYAHHYAKGRTALAVDGPDGAGKTRFADDLALAFERAGYTVFRASVDDFHQPREHRYRTGRYSPEGYYRDAFDYSVLRRVLLEPFRMGGSTGFQLRGFDLERDVPAESAWMTGPAD